MRDFHGGNIMNIVIFDFDRTLCVHNYVRKNSGDFTYEQECRYCLNTDMFMEEHANDRPLACMQWYVREKLMQPDTMLYCVSAEMFSLRDNYKKWFLARHYGGMIYMTVDKPEHKIDLIRALAEENRVQLCDCELVDDSLSTVYAANRAGITGRHISDIMYDYEMHLRALGVDV